MDIPTQKVEVLHLKGVSYQRQQCRKNKIALHTARRKRDKAESMETDPKLVEGKDKAPLPTLTIPRGTKLMLRR